MKRRKFVRYVSKGGGALIAGMSPAAFGENNPGSSFSGKMDVLSNTRPASNLFSPNASCQLKNHNSCPTVFVNGKPCFPLAYISYFPKQFRYKNMRDAGIKFFSLSIPLTDGWVGAYKNKKVRQDKKGIWDHPDSIDFETFDRSIQEILDVAPDAYIFPRIFCDSPGWWDSYHPAETCRSYIDLFPMRQSFSSQIWCDETAEILRKIVRHVYESSYADRFIGIHITAGDTEEGCFQNWLGPSDYSIVAQKKFRKWLMSKYNNDNSLIIRKFNKPIDQITIPPPEARVKAEFGDFFDPEKSRLAIDYSIFRSIQLIESFDTLCKAVKEESNGNMLTGIFYGHTFAQWLDHMSFSEMLKSPNIDFFSSTTFGVPANSITKANKIFYNEGDERTCLSKWIAEIQPEIDPYREYIDPGWVRPGETLEISMENLKSEFSKTICSNSIIWWFDLWGGWYDHEKIWNLFGEMQKVGDESLNLPRNSVSQVCVIVDERSFRYFSVLRRHWVTDIPWIGEQKAQIDQFGAPYDMYLFDDLIDLDLSKYKLLIFFNSFFLSQQDRQMIQQKCMSENRVLLWLYAPGLIGNDISVDHISSLVNMEISYEEKREEPEIKIKLQDQTLNYKGSKTSPFIYIKGGASNIYGCTNDGYNVLAEKKEKNHTNILASNPPVPWQVIQYFAIKAGIHIYSDSGDVVIANQSYLAVRAGKPGKRLIKLPGKSDLLEILDSDNDFKTDTNKVLKRVREIEVDFRESGRVKFFKII